MIERLRGKADSLDALEGKQSWVRYGEYSGHHRGLRAGHVFTEVDRELERANCLLVNESCQGRRLADKV